MERRQRLEPLSSDMNNASPGQRQPRTVMFETLYMYNFLDGTLKPLLVTAFVWNDAHQILNQSRRQVERRPPSRP